MAGWREGEFPGWQEGWHPESRNAGLLVPGAADTGGPSGGEPDGWSAGKRVSGATGILASWRARMRVAGWIRAAGRRPREQELPNPSASARVAGCR
jgi:hypothetical protein